MCNTRQPNVCRVLQLEHTIRCNTNVKACLLSLLVTHEGTTSKSTQSSMTTICESRHDSGIKLIVQTHRQTGTDKYSTIGLKRSRPLPYQTTHQQKNNHEDPIQLSARTQLVQLQAGSSGVSPRSKKQRNCETCSGSSSCICGSRSNENRWAFRNCGNILREACQCGSWSIQLNATLMRNHVCSHC